MYPDMPKLVDAAGQKALAEFQRTGVAGKQTIDIGGIRFEVVVNPGKNGALPNVPTAYPKGVTP